MNGRAARIATGSLTAVLSASAHADNWFASIGQYRADIVYQAGQQMLMVLIAGVAAISTISICWPA